MHPTQSTISSAPAPSFPRRPFPWISVVLLIVSVAALTFALFSCASILSAGSPLFIGHFHLLENSASFILTPEGGKFLLSLGAALGALLIATFSIGRLTALEN